MRGHRLRLWIAVAIVLFAAVAAESRSALHLRPGERLFGELAGGASTTVLVDGVEGMTFSATARAFRGTKLALTMSIAAPDGFPQDVTKSLKVSRAGSTATLRGFLFRTSGPYRLTLSSTSQAAGGFDLDTSGVLPRRVVGRATGASAVEFAASPGDKATFAVRPARGVRTKPLIRRFVDADGTTSPIDAPSTKKPLPIHGGGLSRFDVDALPDAGFTYVLSLVRAKPSRVPRDVAELSAAGVLSGTVVIEGVTSTAASTSVKSARRPAAPDVAAGELVVSLPDATCEDDVVAAGESAIPGARCRVAGKLTEHGPYLVRVEHLVGRPDARARFATRVLAKSAAADGRFRYCETNGFLQTMDAPSDPLFPQQYDMTQIHCPEAWNLGTGSPSVIIAVIDSGTTAHPDLAGAWVQGFDFVSDPTSANDGNGWDNDPLDANFYSHGTHVAGTIAARSENGLGISGVAPNCRLLPVRTGGAQGLATFFDAAAGLRWACGLPVAGAPTNANVARVVNMSFGTTTDSQVMRDAMYAVWTTTDVVVVASAGNNGDEVKTYPAGYPGVISVAAVDSNLQRASYSTHGDWISVCAPGGDQSRGLHGILSTWVDATTHLSQYRELDGSSMAAPHVAGVAALLLSAMPTLSRSGVTHVIESTAVDLGAAGYDSDYGWGLVDARTALESVVAPSVDATVYLAPDRLTFSDYVGRLSFFVGVRGDAKVTVDAVTTTVGQGAGWLSASTPSTDLPAVVSVEVDPNLAVGAYSGDVYVDTSVGRLHVPVTAFRSAPPTVVGVVVMASDERGPLTGRTSTGASLDWRWSMPGVPLGRHKVTAYADLDGSIAADRVDEFLGAWPIADQPAFLEVTADDLDHDGIVVRLARFDSTFEGVGVGGGLMKGAFAVHAVNAWTGAEVPGATMHVLDGASLAVTDARGRAIAVGGFSSGQTVTLAAPGYVTTSRVGYDSQFLGFNMSPVGARATRVLPTTVRGFGPLDASAYVQVGDTKRRVALDGSDTLVLSDVVVVDVPGPRPVSVVAYDASGTPTRRASLFAVPGVAGLSIDVQPIEATSITNTPLKAALPLDFPGAQAAEMRGEAFIRGDDGRWMTLGGGPLQEFSPTAFLWATPDVEPVRETKIEVSGHDAAGRVIREVSRGTTLAPPVFKTTLLMRDPTKLSEPVDAATGVDLQPTLKWTTSIGARVHRVTIETLDGSWRRVLLVAGAVTSVRLPSPVGTGLAAATTYRWKVETAFGQIIDTRSHDDDDFETKSDGFSSSETATFTTK